MAKRHRPFGVRLDAGWVLEGIFPVYDRSCGCALCCRGGYHSEKADAMLILHSRTSRAPAAFGRDIKSGVREENTDCERLRNAETHDREYRQEA